LCLLNTPIYNSDSVFLVMHRSSRYMCGLDQHWALPISEESALTGGAKESALAGRAKESALAGRANESALTGGAPLSNESALTGGAPLSKESALTGGAPISSPARSPPLASFPLLSRNPSFPSLSLHASLSALSRHALLSAFSGRTGRTGRTRRASLYFHGMEICKCSDPHIAVGLRSSRAVGNVGNPS
jgi:hypothetical protein